MRRVLPLAFALPSDDEAKLGRPVLFKLLRQTMTHCIHNLNIPWMDKNPAPVGMDENPMTTGMHHLLPGAKHILWFGTFRQLLITSTFISKGLFTKHQLTLDWWFGLVVWGFEPHVLAKGKWDTIPKGKMKKEAPKDISPNNQDRVTG